MRKIWIVAGALVAISAGARAAERAITFDEAFPVPQSSIENFCNSPAVNHNACIDSAQQDYDYDKAVWNSLDRAHQKICEDRWAKMTEGGLTPRGRYHLIAGCLNDQWRAQDRETVHHFQR